MGVQKKLNYILKVPKLATQQKASCSNKPLTQWYFVTTTCVYRHEQLNNCQDTHYVCVCVCVCVCAGVYVHVMVAYAEHKAAANTSHFTSLMKNLNV